MADPHDVSTTSIRARLAGVPDPVALLEGLFTASPVAFQIYRADGHCLVVNDAFRELFGSEPPPEYNVLRDEIAEANGHLGLIHRAFAGAAVTTPVFWYDARELRQVSVAQARRVALVASFVPLRDADGRVAFVAIAFKDVTPEQQARELAEAGRRRAEAAERRSALLSRVSALLSSALDVPQRPVDLARLLVPAFGDLCSVLLVDETGALRRVGEAACDPEIEASVQQMRAQPLPRSLAQPVAAALANAELWRTDDYLGWVMDRLGAEHPEYVALMRRLWPTQVFVIPMRARGRVLGVITIGMLRATGRSYAPEDEVAAREIGERAGLGIDNARLYAEAEQARRAAEAERAALHASEERRRLAVEAAEIGTWDHDLATGTTSWDARCRALLGVAPEAAVDGALFLAHVHADDRERVAAAIDGASAIDLEYRTRGRDDGDERWVRAKGRLHVDAAGRPRRFIGTLQDISDRKRALRELQAARQRAETANGAKDEFLAMLGHELRNPLSPILTALHLMRVRHGELMAKERAVIERQVQHMVRLVDDLLDVSRITRGKIQLKRGAVEIAQVVDKALEIAAPLLEKRAHRLTLAVPRTGLRVDGDEHRLAQVVANLLTNAARYTDPGGAIDVTAEAHAGSVRLTVRDSGAGIDPELVPRIFELFVQGRRALDRADGGLGLGLAIVRSLVELHGGTVAASSGGPGRGSEFVVRLPLAAVAAPPAPGVAARPAPAGVCRVLIVDDNRDAAELLEEGLRGAGHVTRVAFDGPTALRLAAELLPDVALLDIGLPVMDGFELARRLRELPGLAALRLVALTGYGQPSDRERSRVAGFDEHLTKPVELA